MTARNQTARMLNIPVAVLLERRWLDNPWQDEEWHACAVVMEAGQAHDDHASQKEGGFVHSWQVAADIIRVPADPIEVHAKEVEGCRVNLESAQPVLWVIIDPEGEDGSVMPVQVQRVTASAYEAQEYLDAGDLIVDAVPMPEEIRERLVAFIAAQPDPEPFRKRKNRKADADTYRFGKEPLAVLRERMKGRVPR